MSEMFILGLTAGHDASATVLKDGIIVSHVLRERITKRRHDYGIDKELIELALKGAKITADKIQFIAMTATQSMPVLLNDIDYFNYFQSDDVDHKFRIGPEVLARNSPISSSPHWKDKAGKLIVTRATESTATPEHQFVRDDVKWFMNHLKTVRRIDPSVLKNWQVDVCLSPLIGPSSWNHSTKLADAKEAIVYATSGAELALGMHIPIEAHLDGRKLPGVFVNHHAAHAASSYYSSGFDASLILTHDGGVGLDAGFYFLGRGNCIYPLLPHYLACGQFYDHMASVCGLPGIGGAGKLMGLSSYGSKAYISEGMIGTEADWLNFYQSSNNRNIEGITLDYTAVFSSLAAAIIEGVKLDGIDVQNVGNGDVLSRANTQVAYSAQKIIEQTIFEASKLGREAVQSAKLKIDRLCLSGGVALNCPTNSLIAQYAGWSEVYIEPHCDDGGLSIGAAWWLWHNLLGNVLSKRSEPKSSDAMLGLSYSETSVDSALDLYSSSVDWRVLEDEAVDIAEDIIADRIIFVCRGRSETGPRALGNRSILANPSKVFNWKRVNYIKGREHWRPFAPMILKNRFHDFFVEGPENSPFMLMTHRVKSDLEQSIPAVTHVDGSARVQTIVEADGLMYNVLTELDRRMKMPVVMNTSLNGPGEPIVETPADALKLFLKSSGVEALYLFGRRVTRRQAG